MRVKERKKSGGVHVSGRPKRRSESRPATVSCARELLLGLGFKPSEPDSRPDRPTRPTYRKGKVKVIGESNHCPWITVQHCSSGHVDWYVDVPLSAGNDVVLSLVLALEGENDA